MRSFARLASRLILVAAPSIALSLSSTIAPAAPVAPPPAAKFLRSARAIPGEYLVVLKGAPSATLTASAATAATVASMELAVHAQIDGLAARHAATVTRRYSAALLGFAARMSEADARSLSEDPAVAFVEENGVVHASAVLQASPTWGLDRVDQPSLPLDTRFLQLGQGEGATIYIIDTGILSTHAQLAGRVLPGFSIIEDGRGTTDCNGHGTHVAGTAAGTTYGIAKKAKVVPVRVLDCNGEGTNQGVVDGINYVAGKRTPMAVANLSLGGDPSLAVDQATAAAVAAGIVMAVAAGNENVDACGSSPARAPSAITVGATDRLDVRSSFSNFGACVDLSAPGTDITSAWIASDTDTNTISGTSMATPHVAGAIAAFRAANPTATPAEIAAAITAKAFPNKILDPKGSPNLLLSTRFVDALPPEVSLASPAAGEEAPRDFTLKLKIAEENLESLSISYDGAPLQANLLGPFEFPLANQRLGVHIVHVVARDLNGQSSTTDLMITVGEEGGCSTGGGAGAGTGLLLALAALGSRLRRRR
jgi:Subtilase family/Peptidase inhibitor I9